MIANDGWLREMALSARIFDAHEGLQYGNRNKIVII